MELKHKGDIGAYEMVALAVGVMLAAAIVYMASSLLPGEAVVIDTP